LMYVVPPVKAVAMPYATNIAAGNPERVLGKDQEPAEHSGHGQCPLAHPAQEAAPRQAYVRRQPLRQIRNLVDHDQPPLREGKEPQGKETPARASSAPPGVPIRLLSRSSRQ